MTAVTEDRLQRAIESLGAICVRSGITETVIGGDGKGANVTRTVRPALYAMTWGKRWYVTDADGVQLTKMLGGGDIIASLPIKLPAWWSPEQREAYRIIAVGGVLRPERYTSRDEAFAARGFSERVQRITADLETGAEVPV